MTSYCDVINIVYPVTMTSIRHCSILEFGRGHTIKESPQASPDLPTPLAPGKISRRVLLVTSTVKRSKGRSRTRCCDWLSDLVWSRLSGKTTHQSKSKVTENQSKVTENRIKGFKGYWKPIKGYWKPIKGYWKP